MKPARNFLWAVCALLGLLGAVFLFTSAAQWVHLLNTAQQGQALLQRAGAALEEPGHLALFGSQIAHKAATARHQTAHAQWAGYAPLQPSAAAMENLTSPGQRYFALQSYAQRMQALATQRGASAPPGFHFGFAQYLSTGTPPSLQAAHRVQLQQELLESMLNTLLAAEPPPTSLLNVERLQQSADTATNAEGIGEMHNLNNLLSATNPAQRTLEGIAEADVLGFALSFTGTTATLHAFLNALYTQAPHAWAVVALRAEAVAAPSNATPIPAGLVKQLRPQPLSFHLILEAVAPWGIHASAGTLPRTFPWAAQQPELFTAPTLNLNRTLQTWQPIAPPKPQAFGLVITAARPALYPIVFEAYSTSAEDAALVKLRLVGALPKNIPSAQGNAGTPKAVLAKVGQRVTPWGITVSAANLAARPPSVTVWAAQEDRAHVLPLGGRATWPGKFIFNLQHSASGATAQWQRVGDSFEARGSTYTLSAINATARTLTVQQTRSHTSAPPTVRTEVLPWPAAQ